MIETFVFFLGISIGSFLNVCIHRWPKDESIVKPSSHCPGCQTPIAWKDNIPLLSYLFLRGRCRHCSQRISPRYFAVELFTGLLWFFLWIQFGYSLTFFVGIIYLSILFAVSITDLETGYIPDGFTYFGMMAGILIAALFPRWLGQTVWYWGFLQSLIGLLAGGGFLYIIGALGNFIFRKESMGGGDIKLLAMIGAFLGWQEAILVFLFSPVLALPVGLYAKFVKKAETIPFGPYIAVMGVIFFFFGDQIRKKFFYY